MVGLGIGLLLGLRRWLRCHWLQQARELVPQALPELEVLMTRLFVDRQALPGTPPRRRWHSDCKHVKRSSECGLTLVTLRDMDQHNT